MSRIKVKYISEEYYNRPYEQTLRIAQPRDVDE